MKFHIVAGLDDRATLIRYGEFCYNNKNITYAKKAVKLVANTYKDPRAFIYLGSIYYAQNKLERAEKYSLLAIQNNQTVAMFNLAAIYIKQNKLDLAEKYFLLAIEIHNDADAMYQLATLYEKQNKFELAERYFLLAIEKHNHPKATLNLGMLYYKQNKFELAKKYLNQPADNGDNGAQELLLTL